MPCVTDLTKRVPVLDAAVTRPGHDGQTVGRHSQKNRF